MQLVCPMPTIHFKPVENKRKHAKGMYCIITVYPPGSKCIKVYCMCNVHESLTVVKNIEDFVSNLI